MTQLFSEMTAQELIDLYNEYERKLFAKGRDYEDVPSGDWQKIEDALDVKGCDLIQPKVGLSSIVKREEARI